jgi:hypothetical protein
MMPDLVSIPTQKAAFKLALLTIVLNAVDAFITSHCLATGVCVERNPLMGGLYAVSPELFFFFKNLVGFLVVFLYAAWKRPLAQLGLVVTMAAYAGIVIFELGSLLP